MPLETIHFPGMKSKEGKSSSDFQATPEELRTIQERMKDPKFVELMKEYMESISDPETRAEEEAYLAQAEREAKEGGDYTFDFIFPRPWFVVELASPTTRSAKAEALYKLTGIKDPKDTKSLGGRSTTGIRSFINFCVSDKVEPHSEISTQDAKGSQWHVPVAVSEKRMEVLFENRTKLQGIPNPSSYLSTSSTGGKTSAGVNKEREAYAAVQSAATKAAASPLDEAPYCYVYDAVFHPLTLSLADRSNRFLCFLVEIAVEQINAGYKESNGFEFSRLPSAVLCIGYPRNQTIRKKGNASPFAVDPTAPVLTKPTKHIDEVEKAYRGGTTKTTAGKSIEGSPLSASTSRKESSSLSSPPPHHHTNTQTKDACLISPLPPVQVKHRGSRVELSDTWSDHRVTQKKIGVPEVLVVSIDFSNPPQAGTTVGRTSSNGGSGGGVQQQPPLPLSSFKPIEASAIDLVVSEEGKSLHLSKTGGQPYFEGLISLPFSVEEEPVSAKFDKHKRVLSLELRVQAHHHVLNNANMSTEKTEKVDEPTLPSTKEDSRTLAPPPPEAAASSTSATSPATTTIHSSRTTRSTASSSKLEVRRTVSSSEAKQHSVDAEIMQEEQTASPLQAVVDAGKEKESQKKEGEEEKDNIASCCPPEVGPSPPVVESNEIKNPPGKEEEEEMKMKLDNDYPNDEITVDMPTTTKQEEGGNTMGMNLRGTVSPASTTHSDPTTSSESSSSSDPPAAITVPPPYLSVFSKDVDRVRQMFAKVEEARRAREEAAAKKKREEEESRNEGCRATKEIRAVEEPSCTGEAERIPVSACDEKEGETTEKMNVRSSTSCHRTQGGGGDGDMAFDTRSDVRSQKEGEMDDTDESVEKRKNKMMCTAEEKKTVMPPNNRQLESSGVTATELQSAGGALSLKRDGTEEGVMMAGVEEMSNEVTANGENHNNNDFTDRVEDVIMTDKEVIPERGRNRVGEAMKTSTEDRASALRALEEQQDSWMKRVQDAISQEDMKEMEAAVRRARKEAEKAKKRYEAVLEQEKLEKKIRAKREAAPFQNDHIFAID